MNDQVEDGTVSGIAVVTALVCLHLVAAAVMIPVLARALRAE